MRNGKRNKPKRKSYERKRNERKKKNAKKKKSNVTKKEKRKLNVKSKSLLDENPIHLFRNNEILTFFSSHTFLPFI